MYSALICWCFLVLLCIYFGWLTERDITFTDLLDRGWRSSGCYLYKPEMETTCCPAYTIRLRAKDFIPSKEQLRVSRRMQRCGTTSSLRQFGLRKFYSKYITAHLTSLRSTIFFFPQFSSFQICLNELSWNMWVPSYLSWWIKPLQNILLNLVFNFDDFKFDCALVLGWMT